MMPPAPAGTQQRARRRLRSVLAHCSAAAPSRIVGQEPAAAPLSVCLAGCTGGVGSCILEAILGDPSRFSLHSAVARSAAGSDAATAIGSPGPCGVTVVATLREALDQPGAVDVLIDYTHPSQRLVHIQTAVASGVPAVIGTTGYSAAELEALDQQATEAGLALVTGNFSITAACLQHFALQAASQLPHWAIREVCKDTKPDIPSGTARELAELMAEVRPGGPAHTLAPSEHIGIGSALGAEIAGTRVHATRLPGVSTAMVEVTFGLPGETLTMKHESGADDSIFVRGTLLAAQAVARSSSPGLIRGLDKLLFE